MYTAVLMLAMTAGADSIEHCGRNCYGCYGCSGPYAACYGCYGGYSSCGYFSICGGCYYSGCYGGYSSCGYNRIGYGGYYGATPYYASGPYYMPSMVAQTTPTEVRRSFYPTPSQNAAMVRVLLPNANAEIWFDGTATQQRGMERTYLSPALEPGKYKYTIKGRWTEDGRTVNRERVVEVQTGQAVTVDLRSNANEKVSAPKTPAGKPPD